ncbi:hypothetical protein QJS66_00195 [Kocuria rhizophila]|nr:hypothetical protein QJS66_00195 [Kocuria rhizophila]
MGASMHEIRTQNPVALRAAPVSGTHRGREPSPQPAVHPTVVLRPQRRGGRGELRTCPWRSYWLWARMLHAGADMRNVG